MSYGFRSIKELHMILPIAEVPRAIHDGLAGEVSLGSEESPTEKVQHYARLFFNGHNPVLRGMLGKSDDLCVLKISAKALTVPQNILADRDVYDPGVNFFHATASCNQLNFKILQQVNGWTDPKSSVLDNALRGKMRSATLLVPGGVPASEILGIYVASEMKRAQVLGLFGGKVVKPLMVRPKMFFEGGAAHQIVSQSALQKEEALEEHEWPGIPFHSVARQEGVYEWQGLTAANLEGGSDDEEGSTRGLKTDRDLFKSDLDSDMRSAKYRKIGSPPASPDLGHGE